MGCKATSLNKKEVSKRNEILTDFKSEYDNPFADVIENEMNLKKANIGKYFAETELFGSNVSQDALRQLQYRYEKWWKMCTYKNPEINQSNFNKQK